jgi:hypothetical protein
MKTGNTPMGYSGRAVLRREYCNMRAEIRIMKLKERQLLRNGTVNTLATLMHTKQQRKCLVIARQRHTFCTIPVDSI